MTESNHTPIRNGLLFDGVLFWPGQQSHNLCVRLCILLQRGDYRDIFIGKYCIAKKLDHLAYKIVQG